MNGLTCTYRHIAALGEGCSCCTDMNVLLCESMLQLENKDVLVNTGNIKYKVDLNLVLHFFVVAFFLTLLHSQRPKLYTILAFLSAIGLG